MKTMILLAALAVSHNASAALFKCSLISKYDNGSVVRVMSGYVDSSDALAQIEINSRDRGNEPFAMVTAFKNGSKDVVDAQLVDSKTGKRLSTATMDQNGNTHMINCFGVN